MGDSIVFILIAERAGSLRCKAEEGGEPREKKAHSFHMD